MVSQICHPRVERPHVRLELSCAALRQALGPLGMPATLTFTFNALTVTTPVGHIRIAAHTVATTAPGVQYAGLRPRDADVLRGATDGPDGTVSLAAGTLTVTLTNVDSTVSTGRW